MALSQNLQFLAGIAIGTWFALIAIALVRLRHVPIEVRQNEIPKMMILASSCTGAITLAITVLSSVFFPQFLEDNSAALYTAGFLGSAILLWWTVAVFWREIKLISAQVPKPPKSIKRTRHVVMPSFDENTSRRTAGFAILRSLLKESLTTREIKTALDVSGMSLSEPTFLRLVHTLLMQGLVMRSAGTKGYNYQLTSLGRSLVE
jgi:hypothetical protein